MRTRPTSDRVREAMFNALWSRGVVDGARVLDLFAGSGALGIEALSRGAAHATFVDDDRRARRAIARNLASCGLADRAEVIAAPAVRYVEHLAALTPSTELTGTAPTSADAEPAARFDLVFCDPPYAFAGWHDLLAQLPASFVVAESSQAVTPPAGWDLVRESRYGDTWVGFMSR